MGYMNNVYNKFGLNVDTLRPTIEYWILLVYVSFSKVVEWEYKWSADRTWFYE